MEALLDVFCAKTALTMPCMHRNTASRGLDVWGELVVFENFAAIVKCSTNDGFHGMRNARSFLGI